MAAQEALFAFLLIISLSLALSEAPNAPSAYEMLEKFNFPKGILPEGVDGYWLGSDGRFEVFLKSDCEFKVDGGYLLKYKRKITGRVESGSLKELGGVSVKVLMMWFGINEVVRSNAELNFYVGPLSASFAISNFEDCPRCGCGFDCGNILLSDS